MAKQMKNRAENDLKNKWNSMMRTMQRAELESKAGKSAVLTKKPAPKSILVKKVPLKANEKPAPRKVHFSVASRNDLCGPTLSVLPNPTIMTSAAPEGTQITPTPMQKTQTSLTQACVITAARQEEKKESNKDDEASALPKSTVTEPESFS
jgi:hypothetical protein